MNKVNKMLGKNHTVVVIDDEESMRDSCRMILEKEGFRAETASDGTAGISLVKELKPEIALIDLKMPGISGLEVLDQIKAFDPEIIPIVITGYATVESAVEAMKRGAYDFLPKPFTPEELRLIIKRGLEHIRLVREAEALRKEKKLMEENFITMVSHQLRSPLVAIAQYFEVILGGMVGEIPAKSKDMLSKAKDRLEGLLELINDWLDIARMNGGKLVEKGRLVDLRELLTKQVDFLRPLAEKNQVSLHSPEGSEVPRVSADEETLEQVFSNLITNAIKYNRPQGSVRIRLYEENGFVAAAVQDTGIGIGKEHIPHIFDQFYRVKRSESAKQKGSGLGLTIAKKIIDAHGGTIRVSSREGEGSTFTVLIPKEESDKT